MLTKSWPCQRNKRKRGLGRLVVTWITRQPQAGLAQGRLHAGSVALRCALGRAGVSQAKREGDHATPSGTFRLLGVFFRRDRLPRPALLLPARELKPNEGWCDDPASALYNRLVTLPCRARHEKLWRADRLYDLVIVID